MDEFEPVRCVMEVVLGLAALGFWALSSHRFGAGVDTSLHPMRGRTSILFALALAVIVGLALCLYVVYKIGVGI